MIRYSLEQGILKLSWK